MNTSYKYAGQAGGMMHLWANPNSEFKHLFLRLNLDCEPDKYSGVVIFADKDYMNAKAVLVNDLCKELPALMKDRDESTIVYWWLERDIDKAREMLALLSKSPKFADIR